MGLLRRVIVPALPGWNSNPTQVAHMCRYGRVGAGTSRSRGPIEVLRLSRALRSQTTRTLRASSPLRPGPISNSTVWPSFKRRFVVSALDIGAVDEDVIAVFSRDEAEALGGVEEFHGSCCQCSPSSPAQSLRLRPRRKPRRDTQPGTQPVGDSSPRDSARLRLAHMCRYGRVVYLDRASIATPTASPTPTPTAIHAGASVAAKRATPTPTPMAVAVLAVVPLRPFLPSV